MFFCLDAKEPKDQGLHKALVARGIACFIHSCRRWFLYRREFEYFRILLIQIAPNSVGIKKATFSQGLALNETPGSMQARLFVVELHIMLCRSNE